MSDKISIFVIDDHRLFAEGLIRILSAESEFEVIGHASNGKEGVKKVGILKPDVALVDMDMPLMNGLQAVPLIQKDSPETKIAIVTMHREKPLIEKMMKLGVNGYFLKNGDSEDLVDGIKKIHAGKSYYGTEVTENLVFDSGIPREPDSQTVVSLSLLTSREQEILALVAQGQTNKEIGEELFISARTVDSHRQNLLKKLEVKNIAGLIRFAIKAGLID